MWKQKLRNNELISDYLSSLFSICAVILNNLIIPTA